MGPKLTQNSIWGLTLNDATRVFDHDRPTSAHAGFAHFQHGSSLNTLHRVRAGGRPADGLPPRLAEHQFDVARPDERVRLRWLALRRP